MPLNCYDGACYYNSWTIPDAASIMMFITLRGWNAVVNKFFGTANDFETQRYLADGKFTGDLYETSGNQDRGWRPSIPYSLQRYG